MVTPPPLRLTFQNQPACGPSCFSAFFTRWIVPNAPSSINRLSRTYLGVKHSSSAYMSLTLAFLHAEELCFTPKYVRLKRLIDEGALGTIHLVKQAEKHDGPHAGWFWNVKRSGGGAALVTCRDPPPVLPFVFLGHTRRGDLPRSVISPQGLSL